MRRAIYVTATVVVLLVVSRYAFTQGSQVTKGRNPPVSVAAPSTEVAALATNRALQRTYIFSGIGPSSIPASTFTAVDPKHTIVCPGTSGTCTITADMSVQVGGGSTASNYAALALFVDGNLVCNTDASNGCHYTIEIPSDSRFVEANGLNSLSGASVGNHFVQTQVWSDNGTGGPGFYNIRYQVYKP